MDLHSISRTHKLRLDIRNVSHFIREKIQNFIQQSERK